MDARRSRLVVAVTLVYFFSILEIVEALKDENKTNDFNIRINDKVDSTINFVESNNQHDNWLTSDQYQLEVKPNILKNNLRKRRKKKNNKNNKKNKHRRRHMRTKRLRSRKEKKKLRNNEKRLRRKGDIDNRIHAIASYDRQNSIKLKNSIDLKEEKRKMYQPTNQFDDFLFNNEVKDSNETQEFKRKFFVNVGKKQRNRHNPHRIVKKRIVAMHNLLRGKVQPSATNMLAMAWNQQAAKQAQKWANQCQPGTQLENPSIRWTPTYGTCGQNIHVAFKKIRWTHVIKLWWNEKKYFTYGYKHNNITQVGKYTQMVWHNSHKVGCGFSQCASPSGKMFYRYVCNYCPTGNDPRKLDYPYTQGDRCASCPKTCRILCEKGKCRPKLCKNFCHYTDLWSNCGSLATKWKEWLCNTKTIDGVIRFKNCRATCQCTDKIT